MKDNLLQEGDNVMEAATGIIYIIFWVSKKRAIARNKGYYLTLVRDISTGIKTYPKSDRAFTLLELSRTKQDGLDRNSR